MPGGMAHLGTVSLCHVEAEVGVCEQEGGRESRWPLPLRGKDITSLTAPGAVAELDGQ